MGRITKFRGFGWVLCAFVGVCAAGHAFAQAASPIRITNAVFHEVEVTAADGKVTKKLVPALKVAPGGEVIYRIEVSNTGKQPATDLAVDNPVPAGLVLTDDSETPPTAVSVDGGKTYGELTELVVTAADGTSRAAQLSDVTHLRWILARLAPAGKSEVGFRARVK